jgi:hypothetical protein
MSTKKRTINPTEAGLVTDFLIMEGMEVSLSADNDAVTERLKMPMREVSKAYPGIEAIQIHGLFCYAVGTVVERRRWHAREKEAGRAPHVDVRTVGIVLAEIAKEHRQHRKRKPSHSVRSKQRRKKASA